MSKAICEFRMLTQEVKKARLDDKGKAWEKDFLGKLCTFMGLGDKITKPRTKKAKKFVPPPAEDTPTKQAFELAFK